MVENLTNCFYCQGLKNSQLQKGGKCAFCGVFNNSLYSVIYENKEKFFCCGCAWWQFPRSEQEKKQENKWYQKYKKGDQNPITNTKTY